MTDAADLQFMARALRVAEKARYFCQPNPAVGCVLVKDDLVIAEGHTQPVGQPHAEAGALQAAGNRAQGATAYVTLEPCSFHGRTPPCSQALIDAGVARVVVAMLDPDERNAGKGMKMLEAAGIEAVVGLLASSAADIYQAHIKRHTIKKPFVRLKQAMTLDGKTALANRESKWITSSASRADAQRYRAMSSAIVTGVQTVIDDDPMMNVRVDDFIHPSASLAAGVVRPVFILDSGFRVPTSAKLLQQASTVIVGVDAVERELPVESILCPGENGSVDLAKLLEILAEREHSDVLFECGATLGGAMMEAHLVDELIVYVAPRLIGNSGRSLLNMEEVARMPDLTDLTLTDVRQIGPDIRITALVNH